MNTKHTPGPWAWVEGKDSYLLLSHRDGEVVLYAGPSRYTGERELKVRVSGRLTDLDPLSPNAKLLEAAPVLFEALKHFVDAVESQEIIIQENYDNDGYENAGGRLYLMAKEAIKGLTE